MIMKSAPQLLINMTFEQNASFDELILNIKSSSNLSSAIVIGQVYTFSITLLYSNLTFTTYKGIEHQKRILYVHLSVNGRNQI